MCPIRAPDDLAVVACHVQQVTEGGAAGHHADGSAGKARRRLATAQRPASLWYCSTMLAGSGHGH